MLYNSIPRIEYKFKSIIKSNNSFLNKLFHFKDNHRVDFYRDEFLYLTKN